jgi:hypothetical protein
MNRDALARLAVAPELVLLRLVEHTLDAMLLALRVEHPTIFDRDGPATTPTLRRARALDRAARRLRRQISAYRAAVDAATSPHGVATDDDLPF